ncbi:MAG: hypothetical protein LBV54_07035, partial [Puniceicoccales bacterium]|nr:hypothetical protein [Puniceicoccales bacterium]
MNSFLPEQLQNWSGGVWHAGLRPVSVNGFSNDTRTLVPGNCFVALRTKQRDGHTFLNAAAKAGAVAALVENHVPNTPLAQLVVDSTLAGLHRIAHHWRLTLKAPVIGVTGSVGKTSTKNMLGTMLGAEGFATKANLNNLLGVPLMLLSIEPARHTSGAVIEAGMSEPGELEQLAQIICPDVAVITNVQPAHLAGLGSLEAIAREKSALAHRSAATVFPASCLAHTAFRELPGRLFPVVFPGDTPPESKGYEDIFCIQYLDAPGGRRIFVSSTHNGIAEYFFPESTVGMARNAAIAAVTAAMVGIPIKRIREALAAWHPSAQRGEVHELGGRLFYIDCYNASPASVIDAAQAFDRRTNAGTTGRLFILAGMNELG